MLPFDFAMGNCQSESQVKSSSRKSSSRSATVANDVNRPVDVPCPNCGAFNYLDAGKKRTSCFKCGGICDRFSKDAENIKKVRTGYDRAVADNFKERAMDAAAWGAAGAAG